MLDPFTLPFVQEAVVEILLLSVAAGLIGTWIVLRGFSFYSHAVGTAAFPGLVLADGLGFSAALGAFGMAGVFTGTAALISRSRRSGADSVTALVLVACLAAGVILASDVFASGAEVDTLLFGSLLAIGPGDLLLATAAAIVAIIATGAFSARWLARGFDRDSAASLKSGSAWFDLALLGVVAFTVTASLSAVGALLVAALIVIPAATVRLITHRVGTMQAGTVFLAAAEGVLGVWLSVKTDAPPGATIAVVSGAVFALVLAANLIGRRRTAAVAAVVLGSGLVAVGCGDGGTSGTSDRVQAVATTTQVADLVSEVAGDRVEVAGILRPDTDPHDYEPRPSDVVAVADAAIVFSSGGETDPWIETLVEESGSGAEIVDLSAGLPVRLAGEDGSTDPHWWHDPVNAKAATASIASALTGIDPKGRQTYLANGSAMKSRISSLDRSIAACLGSLPPERRRIVTNHDAFGYFTDRYGLRVVGSVIPALTTEAEPSAGDLAELEQTIEEEKATAVFSESSLPDDLADAIAADSGATAGRPLYVDSLGDSESGALNYIGMMRENADTVMLALTGGRRDCGFE